MEMTGERRIPAPRERVWDALNDPEVLKACIPGCETLEKTSENEMRATAAVKIGPIAARFNGKVQLADLDPPNGYTISGEGQGGVAGFAKGGAKVNLVDDAGATLLHYGVQAQVGGKIAQLGARLVDATAKNMADQFFDRFTTAAHRWAPRPRPSRRWRPRPTAPPPSPPPAPASISPSPSFPASRSDCRWSRGSVARSSSSSCCCCSGCSVVSALPATVERDGGPPCRAGLYRRPRSGHHGASRAVDAATAVPRRRAGHRQDGDRQVAGGRARPAAGAAAMLRRHGPVGRRLRMGPCPPAHGDPAGRGGRPDRPGRAGTRHLHAASSCRPGRCCRRSTPTSRPPCC